MKNELEMLAALAKAQKRQRDAANEALAAYHEANTRALKAYAGAHTSSKYVYERYQENLKMNLDDYQAAVRASKLHLQTETDIIEQTYGKLMLEERVAQAEELAARTAI
jgi:hypothetical protein